MAKKPILIEVLTDPLHYLGWLLSTIGIIAVFVLVSHLLGIHLVHTTKNLIIYSTAIFLTVVIIDSIKHVIKLQ